MDLATQVVHQLQRSGVNFVTTYPGIWIRRLYTLIHKNFHSISVTKEEEGVGICAGASLAGANPAMLIQSTGFGNMINALCSLTQTYQLPLLILASWRGVFHEKIPAQVTLGKCLPEIFKVLGCRYSIIQDPTDLPKIIRAAKIAYKKNTIEVLLISPQFWQKDMTVLASEDTPLRQIIQQVRASFPPITSPSLTRYEILKLIAPFFKGKLVVSNIGFPSRELYHIQHQPSNFYMLGSLGLASSIGLGVAMFSHKEVVVIDGDGSLLSNLGSLATIAQAAPTNLTVIAIDNGVHGSTGNQATATRNYVDLAETARGLGIKSIYRGSTRKQINIILSELGKGPNFFHIPAQPGNADVQTIPLVPHEIKRLFMKKAQNNAL